MRRQVVVTSFFARSLSNQDLKRVSCEIVYSKDIKSPDDCRYQIVRASAAFAVRILRFHVDGVSSASTSELSVDCQVLWWIL